MQHSLTVSTGLKENIVFSFHSTSPQRLQNYSGDPYPPIQYSVVAFN